MSRGIGQDAVFSSFAGTKKRLAATGFTQLRHTL